MDRVANVILVFREFLEKIVKDIRASIQGNEVNLVGRPTTI